ncbi:MAG: hypothetical protein LC794_00010 [Acidobacteria bacterium]|nr:hypothetical protein [Acidobacteriota bacterium]
MNDWIGLAIIGFLVLCGLFGLSRLSKPYDVSAEEFERRAQEGPGLLGAGLVGIQKALDPSKEKAVEVLEDLKQGRYDGEQGSGEPPEAGSGSDEEYGSAANEDKNSEREKPNA